MIGFLDTGIDYRHPVFRNIDGSTRIVGIWDQTDQTGNPPEGLDYGSSYTKEQIDEALRESDPFTVVPQRDENGHGTLDQILSVLNPFDYIFLLIDYGGNKLGGVDAASAHFQKMNVGRCKKIGQDLLGIVYFAHCGDGISSVMGTYD